MKTDELPEVPVDPNLPHGSDLPPAEDVICSQGNAPHMCDYPEELAYTGDASWWLLPIALGLVGVGAILRRSVNRRVGRHALGQ